MSPFFRTVLASVVTIILTIVSTTYAQIIGMTACTAVNVQVSSDLDGRLTRYGTTSTYYGEATFTFDCPDAVDPLCSLCCYERLFLSTPDQDPDYTLVSSDSTTSATRLCDTIGNSVTFTATASNLMNNSTYKIEMLVTSSGQGPCDNILTYFDGSLETYQNVTTNGG
jgi:hypothetical protein